MTDAVQSRPAHQVRPFAWSLRRELWENRSIYLAPLAVGAVILAGYLFSVRYLPHLLQTAAKQAHFGTDAPFEIAAAAVMVTALIVGAFYALGALHGERRDRTILFWKSLPVSDLTAVGAKAVTALVILPLAATIAALATVLLMLAAAAVVLSASGVDMGLLAARLHPAVMLAAIPYSMAAVALWYAPIVGWLMVVSGWAKRMTFVWAIAPPAAVCIFERLAFGTTHAWRFLLNRLAAGFDLGFTAKEGQMVTSFDEFDPMAVVTNAGVWGGLLFLAACLALCVWLRRRRDPI